MSEWYEDLRNRKLIIWGASIGGGQAIECLHCYSLDIEAFCDNNPDKIGKRYCEKRIISSCELRELVNTCTNYCVLIASFAWETIYEQIRSEGLCCDVYVFLLYDPCHLKKQVPQFSSDDQYDIRSRFELEGYTTRLLGLILEKGYLNRNGFARAEELMGFGGIDAYYYDDIANTIIDRAEPLTLIDGGAYIGDSILQISKVFNPLVKRVYAFEPNTDNLNEIRKLELENVEIIDKGLSERTGFMYFTEKGCFYKVSDSGQGDRVPVVAIDDLDLQVEGRCILKLDIEGSEGACLRGAENFIKRVRPYIVVCLYHKPEDIMELPKMIKSMAPEYKLYLRGGMHTVCYGFIDD